MAVIPVTFTLDTTVPAVPISDGLCGEAGWLEFGGREVANNARVGSYVNGGLAHHSVQYEGCICGALLRDVDTGSPLDFIAPTTDTAPWYDETRPESADFLGFYIASITPGTTTTRSFQRRGTSFGGAALGPERAAERTYDVAGQLVSRSYAGREFGKRWLNHVLSTPICDPCGSNLLRYRTSCPPDDGLSDDIGLWLGYDAALIDGPSYANLSDSPGWCDATFQLLTGNPYIYKPIEDCLPGTILTPPTHGSGCMDFISWFCGPGGGQQCCQIAPPSMGVLGTVLTIDAPDGLGAVVVGSYANCPPDPTDTPITQMTVNGLPPGTLVINSSLRTVTFTDPDGNVFDGTTYISLPDGMGLPWVEVADCDPASCLCVRTAAACSGGETTTVSIATQLRMR